MGCTRALGSLMPGVPLAGPTDEALPMGMFSPWSWVYGLRLAPFRAKYFGLEAVPSLA
jgi:hypothetical protein